MGLHSREHTEEGLLMFQFIPSKKKRYQNPLSPLGHSLPFTTANRGLLARRKPEATPCLSIPRPVGRTPHTSTRGPEQGPFPCPTKPREFLDLWSNFGKYGNLPSSIFYEQDLGDPIQDRANQVPYHGPYQEPIIK